MIGPAPPRVAFLVQAYDDESTVIIVIAHDVAHNEIISSAISMSLNVRLIVYPGVIAQKASSIIIKYEIEVSFVFRPPTGGKGVGVHRQEVVVKKLRPT